MVLDLAEIIDLKVYAALEARARYGPFKLTNLTQIARAYGVKVSEDERAEHANSAYAKFDDEVCASMAVCAVVRDWRRRKMVSRVERIWTWTNLEEEK
jgi:hypothetical protein